MYSSKKIQSVNKKQKIFWGMFYSALFLHITFINKLLKLSSVFFTLV